MTTLVIPGPRGREFKHWQHWWVERDPRAIFLAPREGRRASPQAWRARLLEAVHAHPYAWIVTHDLGASLLVGLASERLDLCIAGALIVAPAGLDPSGGDQADFEPDDPDAIAGFSSASLAPLPFAATVVASRSDPLLPVGRARELADAWGARFVDYGDAGHIDRDAGFGPWPDGCRFLAEVQSRRRLMPGTPPRLVRGRAPLTHHA